RSGRSASTHGWVSQAKTSRTEIKAKNDGGRSHAREAWGWVRWGLPTTGVYCPTVTLVGHQVGQQKCPPLLVLSDLSDLSDLFQKTEHAALPQQKGRYINSARAASGQTAV